MRTKLAVILCFAMAGLSPLSGQPAQWIPTNGPFGGYAPTIATNANGHVYVGAQYGAVFRSTNSGVAWSQINSGTKNTDVVGISFGSAGEIYITGSYSDMYRSLDDGRTWTPVHPPIPSNEMKMSLIVNSAGHLILGTEYGGLWRSTDKGDHWSQTDAAAYFIWDLVNSENVTLARTGFLGVYRSTDNGASWQASNAGLGKPTSVASIMTGPGATVYAYTDSGLFRSLDNGATWSLFGSRFNQTGLRRMVSGWPNIFYAIADSGLYRSADGSTWNNISSGIADRDVRAIAAFGTHVYVNSYNAGMYHSFDSGNSWELSVNGFRAANIQSMTATPGGRVIASAMGATFSTTDKGVTWMPLNLSMDYNSARNFLAAPGNILYAVTYNDIAKSTNDGLTWTPMHVPFGASYLYGATITSAGTIFVGTLVPGVYRSTNSGASWDGASNGLGSVQIAAFAPIGGDTLICESSMGSLFRTTNNGLQWTPLSTPLGGYLSSMVSAGGRTIFISQSSTVMRSTDGGSNWVTATTGLPGKQIQTLAAIAPSTLYASGYDLGSFRSTDNGNSWQPFGQNLLPPFVSAFVQDGDGVTFAGTTSGVYRTTGQSYFRPSGLTAIDVPHDQGGKVTLEWNASVLDADLNALVGYSIWRALPDSAGHPPAGLSSAGRALAKTTAARSISSAWEWLTDVPAHQYKKYSYTAATLFDSMAGVSGRHCFLVSALTSDANIFYDSAPIDGYSVDNLPPGQPKAFAAAFFPGGVTMHWHPDTDPDLQAYVVYRLPSGVALSDTTTPLAIVKDSSAVDVNPGSGVWFYAVRARDIHGNLSLPSSLVPVVITSVSQQNPDAPSEFSLDQNFPNPFNPATELRFALPLASHVRLTVYDAMGREIADLVNGYLSAGFHSVTWDASHNASGIYFYRMTAGMFTQTRRMVLLR